MNGRPEAHNGLKTAAELAALELHCILSLATLLSEIESEAVPFPDAQQEDWVRSTLILEIKRRTQDAHTRLTQALPEYKALAATWTRRATAGKGEA